MRQFLSILMIILSTSVFGQKQREVTFDFTNPSSLGFTTITGDPNFAEESFTKGKVKMSFSMEESSPGIWYVELNGNRYLQMQRASRMNIAGVQSATIQSVDFTFDTLGDFDLASTSGQWDGEHNWSCSGNGVSKVVFGNYGSPSYVKTVKVTYLEPTNILEPTVDATQLNVSSFDKLTLNFASNMTKKGTSTLNVVDEDNRKYPLTATVDGATVSLSLAEAITTDGTYTIKIPAGYFEDASGYCNKILLYTIVVTTPKNTLNYVSVTPTVGEIEKLESPIVLTYDDNIKTFSAELMMKKDGEDFSPVTIERSSTNSQEVKISFDIPQGITKKGIYTIDIPEGTITDQLGKVHNPTFTLTYKVGYKPAPVYSETMKKAIALVSKTGVGYPTKESESRKNLEALVNAEEVPSDETLQPAIEAFYSEQNIEMPTVGKWYYISSVNAAGKSLYLSVKDGVLGVTSLKSEATAFEAGESNMFKTLNGKYLFTNSVVDEDNVGTKTLELKKLAISNVDAEKLLGCFSIYGYYETTKAGKVLQAYASVDFTNSQMATDDHDTAPLFDADYSGAFTFTETVKPSNEPKFVDMNLEVSPTLITENADMLTLTFVDAEVINGIEDAEAKLYTEDGTEVQTVTMTADAENSNVAYIRIPGLENGKYQIIITKGSLSYTKEGVVYKNNETKVDFTVKKSSVTPPSSSFNYTYSGMYFYPKANVLKDVDLNLFTIGDAHYNYPSEPQGLAVDETKEVLLMQMDLGKVIAKGHFKRVDEMPGIPDCPSAYQIELETPITEGSLKSDIYTFVMSKATYGDDNFGKYLKNPSSVSATDCYVNSEYTVSFYVNNDQATGIKEISTDTNRPTVIYDLMGRRVQEMTRPGIYIVNGKKVIKK